MFKMFRDTVWNILHRIIYRKDCSNVYNLQDMSRMKENKDKIDNGEIIKKLCFK